MQLRQKFKTNLMVKLHIGDTIRFLNTLGGGKIKGFQNKHLAIVEDENGFDVPVLISECVLVESAFNEKLKNTEVPVEAVPSPTPQTHKPSHETEQPTETPEGEKITTCLAYLPLDYKNLTQSAYECYLVNDSNYYLYFNYMSRENNTWKSRYNGCIEPNTKMFLEEFDKSQLNEIEKVCVQFIAFKHEKTFGFKNAQSVEIRIDTVKFYKLHSFQENDYFDENALVYYLTRNDIPEREMLVSAGDLERAMLEKNRKDSARPRIEKIERKEKNPIVEIDLHIHELLDNTNGLSNADMLEVQINTFNETMEKYKSAKNQKIVFIHGKGNGVLKAEIMKQLKAKYPKAFVQDASFRQYGYGATMVTIK